VIRFLVCSVYLEKILAWPHFKCTFLKISVIKSQEIHIQFNIAHYLPFLSISKVKLSLLLIKNSYFLSHFCLHFYPSVTHHLYILFSSSPKTCLQDVISWHLYNPVPYQPNAGLGNSVIYPVDNNSWNKLPSTLGAFVYFWHKLKDSFVIYVFIPFWGSHDKKTLDKALFVSTHCVFLLSFSQRCHIGNSIHSCEVRLRGNQRIEKVARFYCPSLN